MGGKRFVEVSYSLVGCKMWDEKMNTGLWEISEQWPLNRQITEQLLLVTDNLSLICRMGKQLITTNNYLIHELQTTGHESLKSN